MNYICVPASWHRGWGFRAVPCEADDPEAVCQMDGSDQWIKPVDTAMFQAWRLAGEPRDLESLQFYGAERASNG